MTNDPKARVMRQVSDEQDKMLQIFEALKYATVENIKVKEGVIKQLEIRISINLDDPESFRKTVDELKTISL